MLLDLPSDGVQFALDGGDDGKEPWQLVVQEVVVVAILGEDVEHDPVVESSRHLGHSGHDWDDFSRLGSGHHLLQGVGHHLTVDAGSEESRERVQRLKKKKINSQQVKQRKSGSKTTFRSGRKIDGINEFWITSRTAARSYGMRHIENYMQGSMIVSYWNFGCEN